MLSIKDSTQTILAIVSSILWIAIVVISWMGSDFLSLIGLILAALITIIYFIIGTSVNGKIGLFVPLIFPIGITLVVWIASFILTYNTQGWVHPDEFIIGLHPGQFWTVILFWLGSFSVLVFSYSKYFDNYLLTEESWDTFMKEVEEIKANLDTDYMD